MGEHTINFSSEKSKTKPGDEIHFDVVFVMGLCGGGKTTLIQQITGTDIAGSHGTSPGTTKPQLINAHIPPNHPVMFIEIPGFDESKKTDAEIIKELWEWIETIFKIKEVTISGVLYVHDIRVERFMGNHVKNLELLKKMTGPGFEKNICIATTKWGTMNRGGQKRARERERALEENEWSGLLAGGAKLWRVITPDLNDDDVMEMSKDEGKKMQEEFWEKFSTRNPNIVMTMQQERQNGVALENSVVAHALGIEPQAIATANTWSQFLLERAVTFAFDFAVGKIMDAALGRSSSSARLAQVLRRTSTESLTDTFLT